MLIGSEGNWIRLEKVDGDGGGGGVGWVWRFEASTAGPGWSFTSRHDQLQPEPDEGTRKTALDFACGKSSRLEVGLLEGGSLRLKRDAQGSILVRYRVVQLSVRSAIEGEIILERAAAGAFCRGLANLF